MNSRNRAKIYKMLAERDGEMCRVCQIRGTSKTLVVDHKDNDNSHNLPENFQLLCKSCNAKKNPRGKAVANVCVGVCEEERPLPPEMIVNLRIESKFRGWVFEKVNTFGKIRYEDALNAGAEHVGASTETIKRYLRKMTSSEGMYSIVNDPHGYPYLHFKK